MEKFTICVPRVIPIETTIPFFGGIGEGKKNEILLQAAYGMGDLIHLIALLDEVGL